MTKTTHTKVKNLLWLLLAAILICPDYIHGQEKLEVDYPKVGDTIKDHKFTDVDNFPSESFKIRDFRGKWLIIDFWSRFCSGCIASFPKMDTLHRKFKDRVQLLMIGLYGDKGAADSRTKDIYYRMKSMHELEFAVAFDWVSRSKFDIGALPTILVINPEGVIVAKTTRINADQISQLLNGSIPRFKRAFSAHETFEYDRDIPLLTNGGEPANGGSDTAFLFRSLLAPYNYKMGKGAMANLSWKKTIESGMVEIPKSSLKRLYFVAYFGASDWTFGWPQYGKFSEGIVLEIADSSDFVVNENTLEGYYAYSLNVPKNRSSEEFLKQVMQSDLRNYFNYDVSIENRLMPAYHLIVTDQEKVQMLRTKGGKPLSTALGGRGYKFARYDVINKKLQEVMRKFTTCFPRDGGDKLPLPIIDRTGIDFNVDFSIRADMLDLDSVNEALSGIGLHIKRGLEEMKTIVVRDFE